MKTKRSTKWKVLSSMIIIVIMIMIITPTIIQAREYMPVNDMGNLINFETEQELQSIIDEIQEMNPYINIEFYVYEGGGDLISKYYEDESFPVKGNVPNPKDVKPKKGFNGPRKNVTISCALDVKNKQLYMDIGEGFKEVKVLNERLHDNYLNPKVYKSLVFKKYDAAILEIARNLKTVILSNGNESVDTRVPLMRKISNAAKSFSIKYSFAALMVFTFIVLSFLEGQQSHVGVNSDLEISEQVFKAYGMGDGQIEDKKSLKRAELFAMEDQHLKEKYKYQREKRKNKERSEKREEQKQDEL